jgi:hypothetical protein
LSHPFSELGCRQDQRASSLQTDIATTKVQLGHLKESVDTRIGNFQTHFESSLARTISNLESNMNSKFDKIDSKFEILENDIKHVVVEFTAEMGRKEARLVWWIVFTVSVVLISLCPPF